MTVIKDWNKIKLGQVIALMRNGYSGLQVDRVTEFPVTRIETISEGTVNYDRVGFVETIPESYELKEGDLLLSNINSVKHIGKVAQYRGEQKLYHGMNLLIIRLHETVDNKFMYYYLEFSKPWFEKMASQAVNQASINQTVVKDLGLMIPVTKVEQTQIADILSTIDSAIEQTEAIIKKQMLIKAGLMQDLLAKGIDKDGNIRSEETHEFKDSPFGRIPFEWDTPFIDDMATHVGSGITPRGGESVYVKEGVTFIRSQNVTIEGLTLEDIAFLPLEINKTMKNSEVFANDVLLNITGASIGRCCYVPDWLGRANVNQHVCAIRFPGATYEDAVFLSSVIESHIGQSQIKKYNAGGNREGLNYQQIRAFVVPWAKLEERKRIVTMLDISRKTIVKEQSLFKKLKRIKSGLMQDLLTGRVPVTELLNKKKETQQVV